VSLGVPVGLDVEPTTQLLCPVYLPPCCLLHVVTGHAAAGCRVTLDLLVGLGAEVRTGAEAPLRLSGC
jgi:hypothetical protein